MGNIAKPIAESLKFTNFILPMVTGDLDDEIARRRARDTEGASIAWIVGHLCHYRYLMLQLLGETDKSPFAHFQESATDGADYPSIKELAASWPRLSERVVQLVEGTSDDRFTAPMKAAGSPHGEKSVLDTMVFFMWHESYHMGQLGTLRAQFGLTPTATLAVEAGAG